MVWRKARASAAKEMSTIFGIVPRRWRLESAMVVSLVGAFGLWLQAETNLLAGFVLTMIAIGYVVFNLYTMVLVHYLLEIRFRIRFFRFTYAMGVILGSSLSLLSVPLLMRLPFIGPELSALLR